MALFWSLIFSLSFSVTSSDDTQTFIVGVQNDLKPSVFPDVEQWYSSTLHSLNSDDILNPEKSEIVNDIKKFIHVYETVFHGFSARLTTKQAEELKNRPEVLAVLPDRINQIQTTHSPQFLGLSTNNGLLTESDFGSNVIIGVLDTGIWPERRSFHDEDLDPIPSRWKGECMEGDNFTKKLCNKKIIGARYFANGYEASTGGIIPTNDILSPRDTNGHGTHTASTAAGRQVANASLFGLARGFATGIAPKARIAVYKICWEGGCSDSDILAAIEKAVDDGVDVISISVGGPSRPYYTDPIAIGCFAAMERGILISASAGNDGPDEESVTNTSPWITTVGASTMDRKFQADLLLANGKIITSASLYTGTPLPRKTFLPLFLAGNSTGSSRGTCLPNSLDKAVARGRIVVCDRGGNSRVGKGQVVKEAGGAGVVIANGAKEGEGLVADSHVIPGLAITESGSITLHNYIKSSSKNVPRATMIFHGTQLGVKPAPIVASFSSRGPSAESVYLLKPDMIAPGVNILAAWPDGVAPSQLSSDPRRTEFNMASGTSMSCPHVSGLAALLKGSHPNWSPAMIKSALMTTAYLNDNRHDPIRDEITNKASNVWGTGAGHVDPEKAVDPGLVYDLTVDDYLKFLCASNYSRDEIRQITRRTVRCASGKEKPWNLNYPAITVAFNISRSSNSEFVITRTITHVSDDGPSTYTVKVVNPKGASVTVHPLKMVFKSKGQKHSFVVRISAVSQPPGEVYTESGKLTWTDGKHQVASLIVVVWQD